MTKQPAGASSLSRARCDSDTAAEWVSADALVPWKGNPRNNAIAVQKVAKSIKRFGFGAPIIARRDGLEVIAGHTRLNAAIKLGMRQVPVRLMDLSEEEAHKLAVADNRLQEEADWDKDSLGDLLSEWGSDATELGFDDGELRKLCGSDEAVDVEEIDVTDTKVEFWITATGMLESQPGALDKLRDALRGIDGVTFTVTTSEE